MRHYRKIDPDRYLQPRRGIYYYWRRIPAVVSAMDSRSPLIRMSLKTDDLAEARVKRDALDAAHNDYWHALILDEDEAKARLRYNAAVRRAAALGFTYRTSSELAAGSLVELIQHVLACPPRAVFRVGDEQVPQAPLPVAQYAAFTLSECACVSTEWTPI